MASAFMVYSWRKSSRISFILFFLYTLFLSFILGLLYRQTKSVGYCLLFHTFANLLNLYFVLKINVIFIIIFIAYLIYTILASNRISKEKNLYQNNWIYSRK